MSYFPNYDVGSFKPMKKVAAASIVATSLVQNASVPLIGDLINVSYINDLLETMTLTVGDIFGIRFPKHTKSLLKIHTDGHSTATSTHVDMLDTLKYMVYQIGSKVAGKYLPVSQTPTTFLNPAVSVASTYSNQATGYTTVHGFDRPMWFTNDTDHDFFVQPQVNFNNLFGGNSDYLKLDSTFSMKILDHFVDAVINALIPTSMLDKFSSNLPVLFCRGYTFCPAI